MIRDEVDATAELEPPRLRNLKRELVKCLDALSRVDGNEFTTQLRVIDLEEELADQRELTARYRRAYEGMRELLSHTGANGDLDRLDELIKEWIGRV